MADLITGYLFEPSLKPLRPKRWGDEVRKLLRRAEEEGLELAIIAHLRGLDGPGSSLDLPSFKRKLTKPGANLLREVPSTVTFTSNFYIKVSFSLAEDPDSIVYVAPWYGIDEDEPYVIKPCRKGGKVELRVLGDRGKLVRELSNKLSYREAPALVFSELFGIKGVKVTCKEIPLMALAGGMESSNAFVIALIAAASMLSGANLTWSDIFEKALYLENDLLGTSTGGQGHLAAILGGVHRHIWLLGLKGVESAFSIPLLDRETTEYFEDHVLIVQAGKKYSNGKPAEPRTSRLVNNLWVDLLVDEDPVGLRLHGEKVKLAYEYAEALKYKDLAKVVGLVNRYVDIRNELCKRWFAIALGLARDAKISLREKYKRKLEEDPDLSYYYEKEGRALAEDLSLYAYGPLGELIREAREEGIAIMPLG
ncbi:MAG: hypothetical protein B6U69_02665, partial [Thermofilum sp. ex4484_15]